MIATAVVVFSETPETFSKRLGLGRERDRELHAWLLRRTLALGEAVADATGAVLVLATDTAWAMKGPSPLCLTQPEGSFEDRFLGILRQLTARGFERIVVVGTDTPGLHTKDLSRAVETTELCVGPSRDGGFYLLGLNRAHVERLSGLPWRRPDLLASLLRRFTGRGRRAVSVLPVRSDLDAARDVDGLRSLLESLASRRRTASWWPQLETSRALDTTWWPALQPARSLRSPDRAPPRRCTAPAV